MKYVNICGISHQIHYEHDNFNTDLHLGEIQYDKALIRINVDATPEIQRETLCHEIAHGILIHIGRNDLSNDETFVAALGNALNQSFIPKVHDDDTEERSND